MIGMNTLARPYAKAAFAVAQEKKQTSQWLVTLTDLSAIVSDPEMADVLRNPKLNYEQVMDIIVACLPGLDADVKNFIHILAYNHRLTLIPAVLELFAEYKAEAEKIVNVEMISAYTVSDEQRLRFSEVLSKKLQRQVQVHCTTDNKLIGGAIIRAGDQVIDGSIRGRLMDLANSLM